MKKFALNVSHSNRKVLRSKWSYLKLRAKLENLETSKLKKRKRLKKIFILSIFSLAIGYAFYSYPPCQNLIWRVHSKIITQFSLDDPLELSTNLDKEKIPGSKLTWLACCILGSLVSIIILANTHSDNSQVETCTLKYPNINDNDVRALPALIILSPALTKIFSFLPIFS